MLKKAASILGLIIYLIGLPLLSWWLSHQFVKDPPLVAPFVLASPLYAAMVFGAIFYYFGMNKWDGAKSPLSPGEFEPIAEAHRDPLAKYVGKVAVISGETLSAGATVWKDWLLVEDKLWRALSPAAREYMLIRTTLRSPRRWWNQLLKNALFVASYVLACISLWFVILLHSALAAGLGIYIVRHGRDYEEKNDRRALAVTGNYDAARQYLTAIKLDSERKQARLRALQKSAVELELV